MTPDAPLATRAADRYTETLFRSEGRSQVARTVTLIPGDGIGPDLTESVKEVIGALDVDIEWEIAEAGETVMDREGTPLPESVLESIRRNKVDRKSTRLNS